MDKRLLWGPILVIILYMFLPWILTRMMNIGVFRHGRAEKLVALTFDDGPDPIYTPLLLDLLRKYQVKATFFVLGSRAEKYPDLIRRIHQEGHEIGIHNYTHKSNWIMLPKSVRRRQVDSSSEIVEQITGVRPILYRPPWGIMNVFDFFLRKEYKIVLWSVMGGDWSIQSEKEGQQLATRMQKRIRGGSVVLLHDSGKTLGAKPEAPQFMLTALQQTLEVLAPKNYSYVTVGEMMKQDEAVKARCMSRTKRTIVKLWLGWERLFVKIFNIRSVDEGNTMLKLRIRKFSGDKPLYLEDGEVIQKGDRIAELHLDNELMFKLGADSRSTMHLTVQLIRRMEKLLPQIMEMLVKDPEFKDVKGLYGVTIIHRGTRKFGFTVVDLPQGLFSVFTKLYLRLLLYVIHPQGKERMKVKSDLLVPKIIAISRQELVNRYIA